MNCNLAGNVSYNHCQSSVTNLFISLNIIAGHVIGEPGLDGWKLNESYGQMPYMSPNGPQDLYRSWNVIEFRIPHFQAWKVMELGLGHARLCGKWIVVWRNSDVFCMWRKYLQKNVGLISNLVESEHPVVKLTLECTR